MSKSFLVFILVGFAIAAGAFFFLRSYRRGCVDSQGPLMSQDNHDSQNFDDEIISKRLLTKKTETSGQASGRNSPVTANERTSSPDVKVIRLLAQQGQPFSGYALLEALLIANLRFGEWNIFHRYDRQGKGGSQILFSLACITKPGTFNLQKMGAFSCSGLSLFMRTSSDERRDEKVFQIMLATAQQLAKALGGDLVT